MIRKSFAVLLVCVLASALCAGTGVQLPVRDYYFGEDGAITGIPAVTGTFIQPWLCEGWTDSQWDKHLDMLLSAGIDTVILQWTAETPSAKTSYAGFPLPDGLLKADSLKSDEAMVEGLLKSAEAKHVKVFLGLNTAEEWWSNAFVQPEWCAKQAEVGNRIAAQLYALYKSRYPHAFYGWYWAWEMYGNLSGYEKQWSQLMNANLDFLSELDGSMPLLFSPFLSSYIRLSPGQEEAVWTRFFSDTRLRAGDIFCPQDSLGAADFTMKYANDHLAAMGRAAQTKQGLLFWVNNENFTKDYKPAPLDRFISQLYVSARYTDTHLCFSYSHYYNPELVDPAYDQAYKDYLRTGKPPNSN